MKCPSALNVEYQTAALAELNTSACWPESTPIHPEPNAWPAKTIGSERSATWNVNGSVAPVSVTSTICEVAPDANACGPKYANGEPRRTPDETAVTPGGRPPIMSFGLNSSRSIVLVIVRCTIVAPVVVPATITPP